MLANPSPTIVFAGGGTGGHIYPNVAIAERLSEQKARCGYHFLVSTRLLDTQILNKHGYPFAAIPIQPLPSGINALVGIPPLARRWRASVRQTKKILAKQYRPIVVSTGGFVSAPVVVAARRLGLPVVLVNLDHPPGLVNRLTAWRADQVFTVSPGFTGQRIGLPLRRSAIGNLDERAARIHFGLDPKRDTLLVGGGSQGAQTINQMMVHLVGLAGLCDAFRDRWQVLHLTGPHKGLQIEQAYKQAGVRAVVQPFCDWMGAAWSAATLAISRAGAGSVAEAWANATPTLFLPYPYHNDQHQRHNSKHLVKIGGARVYEDLMAPEANARQLAQPLTTLMQEDHPLAAMARAMQANPPDDGAAAVASWLIRHLGKE